MRYDPGLKMSSELTSGDLAKRSFWASPVEEVVRDLRTHVEHGLSEKEARERLGRFGKNIIEKPQYTSSLYILLSQFKSPLILILLFAGALTLFLGHVQDSLFIFVAVLINTALGFYQEYKAERALAELKTYLKDYARVVRAGREHEIEAAKVVPGDCVLLAQGDRIPADARIALANDLQVDEAILTGESLPVPKSPHASLLGAPVADQGSMVFAGTLVTQGMATAIVCRTGLFTELGKIASLVADVQHEETPLQKKIRAFSINSGIILGVLTLAIFFVGTSLGYSRLEMFLTSIAIAVAAVPEGLPIAMTVILAIGVQRMARRKGVVRKLIAAETLGSTTIILTDKTGTLTQANMALSRIIPTGDKSIEQVLELALVNTNVLIENPHDPPHAWRMSGRILETALVRSAGERGVTREQARHAYAVLESLPFNAVNKFSATYVRDRGRHLLVFFGAPDVLLAHATLSPLQKKDLLSTIHQLARGGELVVGVATCVAHAGAHASIFQHVKPSALAFEGLLTLRDPVRPSVKSAIAQVERAGIRVLIMTGDHRGTAEAVAGEVGLRIGEHGVLDASDLRLMSDEDLKKRLPLLSVISRVSPADKMRVAKVLQSMGEVVAMTGDGVNDAPSIKQADVGIAMGSGTEVARSVADLVLLDDNFETIAAAVEEGRQILQNIRRVLVYLLSSVADGLILIGGALLTGLALPLNALQILWVNFFTDSFPAVAFAFEKNGDSLRKMPSVRDSLFTPLMKFLIFFIGIATSVLLFVLYYVLLQLGYPEDTVRTFIFASFGSYTLFLAFSARNLEKSIFRYSPFSNVYMLAGTGIGIVLMLIGIYVPLMQDILGTVALPAGWLLAVAGVCAVNVAAVEFGKWLFRRKAQAH